jgi:ADP-ribosylation factor-like protein 13B
MNCIIRDYSDLNSRVEGDMAVQRKQEEQEKKERLERIRKVREERGEDMAGVITANGTCSGGVHDDSDCDVVMANPFKPIADIMVSFCHSLNIPLL